MVETSAELDAAVAAGIAHDRSVVAQRSRERVEQSGRLLVGRVSLAELDRAIGRRREADEAVAAEQPAIDRIALGAVGLFRARRRAQVETGLELIDQLDVAVLVDRLEAANAEIGKV